MKIKLNSQQKSNCFTYIITDPVQLKPFLKKQEIDHLDIKNNETDRLYEISRLDKTFFVIKITSIEVKQLEKIRQHGSEIVRRVNQLMFKSFEIQNLSSFENLELYLCEGAALSNYQFTKYLSKKKQQTNSLQSINIISNYNGLFISNIDHYCEYRV